MPITSLFAPDFQAVLDAATAAPNAFPSPADWRDQWIYFLMVDRFNNPAVSPLSPPFDDPNCFRYQGGKFSGIQQQLPYIKGLGAGAIWLSPVLKNAKFDQGSYHGYGIQDFLHANPFFADIGANADQELRALVDAAHAAGLYVIFDIVLNHAANVFGYAPNGNDGAPYSNTRMDVQWRDANGHAVPAFTSPAAVPTPTQDQLVWPVELQQNEYFRRQGDPAQGGDDTIGDFAPFKQLSTWENDVQRFLIRAYQYVIARYDIDGFRIDTLRYLKGDLPRLFGNSMREFALSIGKKNFFTFGEVLDGNEEKDIARFIGKNTTDQSSDMVGVDAALDYPLYNNIVPLIKGSSAPQAVVNMYQQRKQIEQDILSSHGDATRYFVTFVDNHDNKARIRFIPPDGVPIFDNQVTAGLACLLALPGIPCIYYGTEQGFHGAGTDPAVREALWGAPGGFNRANPFYQQIKGMAGVRAAQAALRYGRFYFRPISGDQRTFGISSFSPGVLAFSRILNDQEVLTVANFNTTSTQTVSVIIDASLSTPGDHFAVLYSNQAAPTPPSAVTQLANVTVNEVDGSQGSGPINIVVVTLRPMETQILRQS
jgi:glycosidase